MATLFLAALATACSPSNPGKQELASSSGVAGSGLGPSTSAALKPAGGGKSGLRGTESTQTDEGPHAGGPH